MDEEPARSSSPPTSQTVTSSTLQHTASFSTSRKSSGRNTPSSIAPGTPPPLPNGEYMNKEGDNEDDLPPLDPRRLTPNLHANLVSEILALRRDIESKDSFIDKLESNLAEGKSEHEELERQLSKKSKETRAIKRQLQSIENGTLSALEELCKERDEANEAVVDLKKRFEATQRQLRGEQEKNDKIHKSWGEDKVQWEAEKRLLQRKHEIAESRLKGLVEEMVALQNGGNQDTSANIDARDFAQTDDAVASLPASPEKVRSHVRKRSSVSTIGSTRPDSMVNGATLADELNDDGDDTASESDFRDAETVRMTKAAFPTPFDGQFNEADRQTGMLPDIKESNESTGSDTRSIPDSTTEPARPETTSDESPLFFPVENYRQGTRQFGSPVSEVEANRRQRWASAVRGGRSHGRTKSEPVAALESPANVTANEVAAPPASPRSVRSFATASGAALPDKPVMISTSTQTDQQTDEAPQQADTARSPPPPTRAPPPVPVGVPEIAIHPPESGPSSPTGAAFSPQVKSSSTQTVSSLILDFRSVAVQTDVIRVDRRRFNLPPHLLPSALKDASESSPITSTQRTSTGAAAPPGERSLSPLPSPTAQGNENLDKTDDPDKYESLEPESTESAWSRFRRSLTSSSMPSRTAEADPFSGNEDVSYSDTDYTPSLPAGKGKRPMKPGMLFDPPTPVPEDKTVGVSRSTHTRGMPSAGSRKSLDRSSTNARSTVLAANSKGKHARQRSDRSGSPSSRASSAWSRSTNPPPNLVIPQRTSSAGIRYSNFEDPYVPIRSTDNTSPTRSRNTKRVGKPPMLRKIRSTSILSSEKRSETNSGFPLSPLSQASFASGEITPAPVPENSVLQIYHSSHHRSSSSQTRRMSSVHPTGNASVGTSIQHSVVDALSATMIGEWMWKYVRKRKSFGITEPSQEPAKTGEQRHKRWVWISPYERSVMWSTKQPSSNSALMGKSGRKLTIQSVLDVKDDNISPKGGASQNVFNRSILILTPSRALKFTATSRERHYLWLTALSFLAHHTSQECLDLSFLPKSVGSAVGSTVASTVGGTPYSEPEPNVSRATSATHSRSGRIPWSAKSRSQQSSGYATPSIPEASASVEGASMAVPPKPTRPAPQAPPQQEKMPSDAALPPNIPRVPGSRNTATYFGMSTKHGRKRSASITGVMTLSSRPSSRRLQASGAASASSYPTTAATNSANHSTKSGINQTSASARNNPGAAAPAPSVPAATNVSANRSTKHFGVSSSRQPDVPALPNDYELLAGNPYASGNLGIGPDLTSLNRVAASDADNTTEFGGNNSFFDAVGRSSASESGPSSRRGDSFSGPGFERGILGGPPRRQPPPVPPTASAFETPPALQSGGGHGHTISVDSVAPPPIMRGTDRSIHAPGPSNANGEDASEDKQAEPKKPYNPPQRKRGRFGLGGRKKDAAANAEANVSVLSATAKPVVGAANKG